MGLVGSWRHNPILILRSIDSEQTFRRNQSLCVRLQTSPMLQMSIQIPQKKFFLWQLHKDVSHLRIPQQGSARAYQMWQEPCQYPKNGPTLLRRTRGRTPCPSTQSSHWLLWDQLCYNTGLLTPISATLDLEI